MISHGNGPQVGLLALQAAAYTDVEAYPLDVLGAETEGMIGYLIEQELGNVLPAEVPFATLLTMIEVDANDPAFANPTKFVGPVYNKEQADRLAAEKGWVLKADGEYMRRVVPSPAPQRIFEIRPIRWLLEHGTVVICAGGGGIPTAWEPGKERTLAGVEAVIDKDLAGELLASRDRRGLCSSWPPTSTACTRTGRTPGQRRLDRAARPRNCASTTSRPDRWAPRWTPRLDSSKPPARRAAIGTLGGHREDRRGQTGHDRRVPDRT